MQTVTAICDALGRRELAARLGRTQAAIGNAAAAGVFPPSWYLIVREMCQGVGVECPEELFGFVRAAADRVDAGMDAA